MFSIAPVEVAKLDDCEKIDETKMVQFRVDFYTRLLHMRCKACKFDGVKLKASSQGAQAMISYESYIAYHALFTKNKLVLAAGVRDLFVL